MGRMVGILGWIMTILISASLAIIVAAGILFYYFGFNMNTPGQIRQANMDLAALHATNQTLQTEVALLQTSMGEQASSVNNARERVDELETLVEGYAQPAATAVALADAFESNMDMAASIQADLQEEMVLVAVVATMQADTSTQLEDLQRRTDRIARFLQRMSDIADDLASEDALLQTATPTLEVTPTPTLEVTPTPTP